MRDPRDLIPYQGNARVHPPAQIELLKSAFAEFGFVNPILIGDRDDVIAGHGRLIAALELGLAEVPTITLSHLSAVQKRALILADNQIAANAGWDEALLARELAAIQEEEFDLEVLGFGELDVEDLLNGLEDGFFNFGPPPSTGAIPDHGEEPEPGLIDDETAEDEEAGPDDLPAPGYHWVLIYVDADGNALPTEVAGDPPKIRPIRD